MIAVYTLDGTELKLNNGSGFTINLVSTAFNDTDEFLGSYSYAVELAYCASNNVALDMANLLENRSARQDIPVILRVFGNIFKRCVLSFTLSEDGYSAFLKIDNGIFGTLLKNKLLPEVFIKNNDDGSFKEFAAIPLSYSLADTVTYLTNSQNSPGVYPAYFFPLKNPGLFGSFSGTGDAPYNYQLNTVNPWVHSDGYHGGIDDYGNTHCFYTPFLSLTWVLKRALEYLGYTAGGNFFTDPLVLDKVIYNTGFFGQATLLDSNGLVINPAKHLPSITLGDLFKKLRTTARLKITFDPDTRVCTFSYLKDILASRQRLDISGHVSPTIKIKSDLPKGYKIAQPVDNGDNAFKNYTYTKEVTIGDVTAPKEVDGYIGTLFTRVAKNAFSNAFSYRVPFADQLGNGYTTFAAGSEAYNETGYNKNAFDLRLLTYRGMQNDDQGALYPYASGDEFDSNGTGATYGMSLWLSGLNGVLQKFNLPYFSFFLRTELVELTAYLPYRILQNIDKTDQIIFGLPDQVKVPSLLNDISFEASQNSKLLQAKLTVYPVYSQNDLPLPSISQFAPGEQVNAGDTYLRMRIEFDTSRDVAIYIGSVKRYADRYANIYFDFFSDAAGTIPKVVNNLAVLFHYIYQSEIAHYYFETDSILHASGSTYQLTGTDYDEHVQHIDGSRFVYRTYSLVTDPAALRGYDYKVIS